MKEKITMSVVFVIFIGIVWIGSNPETITSEKSALTEEIIPFLQEENTQEYFHDAFPETSHVDASVLETDSAIEEVCTLESIETDVLTFSDAFQYYRECLDSDSTFQWKDGSYTTVLAEEVIIQLADSVQVTERTKNNREISNLR